MYMNMYTLMSQTVSDTRKNLTVHVARFRREGVEAAPVIFGDHRRPEAVLLPFETYRLLLDAAENAVLADRAAARLAADGGRRTTLADAAHQFGIDLDAL